MLWDPWVEREEMSLENVLPDDPNWLLPDDPSWLLPVKVWKLPWLLTAVMSLEAVPEL